MLPYVVARPKWINIKQIDPSILQFFQIVVKPTTLQRIVEPKDLIFKQNLMPTYESYVTIILEELKH